MERILNILLWLDAVFSRTHDPILAQLRSLQRNCILSVGSSVLVLLATYFVSSLAPVENTYRPILLSVTEPVSLGLFALALANVFWCAWATYELWRFQPDFD